MFIKLLACLVLPVIVQPVSPHGDEAPPIKINIELKTVVVRIKNALNENVLLCRVDRNLVTEVATIGPAKASQAFRVPTGTYYVANHDHTIGIALPAFWEYLPEAKTLEVEIRRPPWTETEWAWIPAGPAILGDTIGIGSEDERPVRIESLKAYWMGTTEVTNQQYADFLNEQETFDDQWIELESRKCLIEQNAAQRFITESPDHPVVMVSLDGAQAYVDWLSAKTNRVHRLPTESEWEKAARGPASSVYSYGNVYRLDAANQESGFLMPVKSFSPNGFGLYDMTGNVFEWMANRANPQQMDETMNHALRGGSFVLDGMYLRNSFRMRQSPSVMTDDIGFRVLREATEEERQ